ncbi:hypothetical protein KY290_035047 [Solanum tuberosum]|uniref:Uncharacterized protein n=1 Tax=Solanum tuberosum TaxID=4113 RepID=A0ABQ7U603_SOLTU|nr:hypothetical protein KY285_034313 [Solanum tuberosum]KAH0742004.1 hypothetical protein KY290_035047 [Solanum tuberosum]
MPSIKPQLPHMFVLGFGVDLSETDNFKLWVWRRVVGIEINHCMVEVIWSQSLVISFSIANEVYREIMLSDALAGMEKVVGFRNNGDVLFSTRRNDLNYMESLILLKGAMSIWLNMASPFKVAKSNNKADFYSRGPGEAAFSSNKKTQEYLF